MNDAIREDLPSWAGGFFVDPNRRQILLHQRDSKARVNPNMWAFFGGLAEGDESPLACFLREVEEELGVRLDAAEAIQLRAYLNTELQTNRYVFFVRRYLPPEEIILGEGAGFGWLRFEDLPNYPLTDKTRDDIEYFLRS